MKLEECEMNLRAGEAYLEKLNVTFEEPKSRDKPNLDAEDESPGANGTPSTTPLKLRVKAPLGFPWAQGGAIEEEVIDSGDTLNEPPQKRARHQQAAEEPIPGTPLVRTGRRLSIVGVLPESNEYGKAAAQ